MRSVAGIYSTWRALDDAVEELSDEQLGPLRIIYDEPEAAYAAVPETGVEIVIGSTAGLGVGAVVGGAMGWFVKTANLVAIRVEELMLDPLGELLYSGEPEIVMGAAVGALAGGLLGAHAGLRYAEAEACIYRDRIADGAFLLTLELPTPSARHAAAVLRRTGAEHVRIGIPR